MARMPPESPETTFTPPGNWRKSYSTHQKRPPTKTASAFGPSVSAILAVPSAIKPTRNARKPFILRSRIIEHIAKMAIAALVFHSSHAAYLRVHGLEALARLHHGRRAHQS